MDTDGSGGDFQLVPRLVVVPKGTHLSGSSGTPGAAAGLLHQDGTNKLIGPAKSFPMPSEQERKTSRLPSHRRPSPGRQVGEAALLAAAEATVKVVFELVVVPAASRGFAKVSERIRNRRSRPAVPEQAPGTSASFEVAVVDEVALDNAAPENAPIEVTVDEFRERLLSMLIAQSMADSERDFLANAVIRPDEDLDPRLGPALNLVLQGDWAALGEGDLDLVRTFLEGAQTPDGQYELLRIERPQLPPSP